MQAVRYVLVLNLLASCTGDSGVSLDEFATQQVAADCERSVACGFAPDQAACVAATLDPSVHHTHHYDTLIADIGNGTVAYDGGAFARCLDSIRSKGCMLDGAQVTAGELDCLRAFRGTVARGDTCFIDEECVEGIPGACEYSTGCAPFACCAGTCGGPLVLDLAAGSPCTGRECALGTYCKFSGTFTGTCTPTIDGEDAPCDPQATIDGCSNPRYCDATTSTCRTPLAEGATCDPAGVFCQNEEACDPATRKCVPGLAVGAACPDLTPTCVGYARCINGTCVAMPTVGQACADIGTPCLGDASCANGTCSVPSSSSMAGACPAP